jgi:dynein heavy chain 1
MVEVIAQLAAKIEKYKEEYSPPISESQVIRTEMTRVRGKVDCSMKLLDSLSS